MAMEYTCLVLLVLEVVVVGRHSFRATIYVASVYDVKKEMQPSDRLKFSLHACNDNFALSTSDRLNKYRQINACHVFVEVASRVRPFVRLKLQIVACVLGWLLDATWVSFCRFLCLAVFARS